MRGDGLALLLPQCSETNGTEFLQARAMGTHWCQGAASAGES